MTQLMLTKTRLWDSPFDSVLASAYRAVRLLVLLGIAHGSLAFAQEHAASVRTRQRAQQQARAIASELVSSVLDVQLRQLRENHLESLPVYAEIQSMRTEIGRLVDRDMQEVVNLLARARQADEAVQQKILLESRAKIRAVLLRLIVQRQRLHNRMQLAKIAASTRQLITVQKRVVGRTESLPSEPIERRETQTLSTLEDQRDAAAFYQQLVANIEEVAKWPGAVGVNVAKGLELLKQFQVDREFQVAEESLASSQYPQATTAQQAILKALEALLRILEDAQGLDSTDNANASAAIAELISKQETLRDETQRSDLTDASRAEALAESQRTIHVELEQLSNESNSDAPVQSLFEQATAAASEAETDLFEGNQEEALRDQESVLRSLGELQKQLATASESPQQSTARVGTDLQSLERLDRELDALRIAQSKVASEAAAEPAAARQGEQQVGAELAEASKRDDFGPEIEMRLDESQVAVAEAQHALEDPSEEAAEQRLMGVSNASVAIDRASAEVKATLEEAQQRMQAIEASELATGEELLEKMQATAVTSAELDQQETMKFSRPNHLPPPLASLGSDQTHPLPVASSNQDLRRDNREAAIKEKQFEKEPWFAKLPPSVQKAIHAKARGTAPRGYEERLKRYFESDNDR